MTNPAVHPFDLEETEELDLFAEEIHGSQRQDLPPNSLSTLGCECELSTFFCYGCGADVVAPEGMAADRATIEGIGDLETALKWTREKLDASAQDDKVAEVLQTLFRGRNR